MLTPDRIITSDNKYPERANSDELTDEVRANIQKLCDAVNALFADLLIKNVEVSSGFRPSYINKRIQNAAKKSNHMKGLAVDLVDKGGSLDFMFNTNQSVLAKYGVYLESPIGTPGWSHLQCVPPGSGRTVFIP